MDRELLNQLRSARIGGEPIDDPAHFYTCKACGQAVDKRRLGDVFHREMQGHEAIPMNG
jgi:hypothetical protein